MSHSLRAVRGMNDLLPEDAPLWQYFEATLRVWLKSYGYRELRTPILEHTGLFKRAIGENLLVRGRRVIATLSLKINLKNLKNIDIRHTLS